MTTTSEFRVPTKIHDALDAMNAAEANYSDTGMLEAARKIKELSILLLLYAEDYGL